MESAVRNQCPEMPFLLKRSFARWGNFSGPTEATAQCPPLEWGGAVREEAQRKAVHLVRFPRFVGFEYGSMYHPRPERGDEMPPQVLNGEPFGDGVKILTLSNGLLSNRYHADPRKLHHTFKFNMRPFYIRMGKYKRYVSPERRDLRDTWETRAFRRRGLPSENGPNKQIW